MSLGLRTESKNPLASRGGFLHYHNQSHIAGTALISADVPFGGLTDIQTP